MKHIGFGSWIPKRCCLRVALYQQKLQGSTVNGSMLQLGLTLRAMFYHQPACGSRCGGAKGNTQLQQIFWKKVGNRHTLIATILPHFWHFLFSVRTHRFGPWWKMLLLRDTNIFSDWSRCCLRTMGHWKVLNIPIYFLRKRSCYNVFCWLLS